MKTTEVQHRHNYITKK